MNRILLFLIILTSGCMAGRKDVTAQAVKEEASVQKTDFSDQSTWVLGYFVRGQITRAPHSEWFTKGYEEYSIDSEVLAKVKKIPQDGLTIRIVMGTWCPDSRKQVPRFMKIIDAWQFPEQSLTFIGVDD